MKVTNKILNIFTKQLTNIFKTSPRESQIQMALDIENFLFNSNKRFMFVDAPVGTGKSLGALVPTILYCNQQNKSIVYATATKNLQNQIIKEEQLTLQKCKLLFQGETILAMGMSNYACLQKFYQHKTLFSALKRKKIEEALKNAQSGSRVELEENYNLTFKDSEWEKICLTDSRCTFYHCPGHAYRRLFKEKNLLTVTNHNQLIQSWLNEKNGKKPIIPIKPGVLIIDEAHLFDENFLGIIQETCELTTLCYFKKQLKNDGKSALNQILRSIKKVINQKYGKSGRHFIDKDMQNNFRIILHGLQELEKVNVKNTYFSDDRIEFLTDFISKLLSNNYTVWFSLETTVKFNIIPNSFFDELSTFLSNLAKNNKLIFLSGTLTVTNDPVKELVEHWKIDNFEYKHYDSPFDIAKQAYLFVPEKIKNSREINKSISPCFISQVMNVTNNLLHKIPGGFLLLNNSLELLDSFKNKFGTSFSGRNVYSQGDGQTNEELTIKFKNDTSSLLLGSGSFYSGFSVPGASLQGVIITTLPFPVPNDPFVQLQQKEFSSSEDSFKVLFQLMLKKLEQGIGRLIRTTSDYGVICITDSRIYTHSYSSEIQEWFKRKGFTLYNSTNKLNEFMENQQTLNTKTDNTDKVIFDISHLNIPKISEEYLQRKR